MTYSESLENLIIVGGGTAGWMTAAMLAKQTHGKLNITLIESEQIGTIGVGEATIPPIRRFNKMLGIDENEFLAKSNGSIKLGIQFENWLRPGHSYFHQFGRFAIDFDYIPFPYFWMQEASKSKDFELQKYSPAWQMAEENKYYPPPSEPRSLFNGFDYAYHFDAGLYAKYLREFAVNLGVNRIEGKIEQANLNKSSGFVESVILQDSQVYQADFFVDCSGMRALLLGQTLEVGFEDWSNYLLNDRAIAVQTSKSEPLRPYTRSIAHHAGWRWQIPLQTRTGNGNVHSSQFMQEQEAIDLLVNDVEGELKTDPIVVRYKTGRREKFWFKNCVAIGLSAGFLEPLESTSIHLIESAIMRLVNFFPNKTCHEVNAKEFNRLTTNEYNHIRDFIVLHYKATEREDSEYWRYCKYMEVPETLQEQIELFKTHGHLRVDDKELFKHDSWLAVLIGQGVWPKENSPILTFKNQFDLDRSFKSMLDNMKQTVEKMPTHEQFLMKNCPYTPS